MNRICCAMLPLALLGAPTFAADVTVAPGEDIQAALDAIADEAYGTCVLLDGTHVIDEPLRVHSTTQLIGQSRDGTVLTMAPSVTEGAMIVNAEPDVHDVTISRMTIDGGVSERETELYEGDDALPPRRIHGILLVCMQRPYMREIDVRDLRIRRCAMNVHIKGVEGLDIYDTELLEGGGFELLHNLYLRRCHNVTIVDCFSHDSRSGNGFQASFCSDVDVFRCVALNNGGHGIRVAASDDVRLLNNTMVGNRNGLWLNSEKGENTTNVVLRDLIAMANREVGLWIRNTRGCEVENCTAQFNGTDVGFRNAFEVTVRNIGFETRIDEKDNDVEFVMD
jgi:parallel beta-helix repeat protein